MFPIKKIVCPTDFSEGSLQSLREAAELASHFGAELYLVHVIPVVTMTVEPGIALNVIEYEKTLHEAAERRLKSIAEPLANQGLRVQTIIGDGEPALEIVYLAREQRADLIVIATHGNTGWRHLAFGSVAEKVVRLATCPVLSIRRKAEAAPAMKAAV